MKNTKISKRLCARNAKNMHDNACEKGHNASIQIRDITIFFSDSREEFILYEYALLEYIPECEQHYFLKGYVSNVDIVSVSKMRSLSQSNMAVLGKILLFRYGFFPELIQIISGFYDQCCCDIRRRIESEYHTVARDVYNYAKQYPELRYDDEIP